MVTQAKRLGRGDTQVTLAKVQLRASMECWKSMRQALWKLRSRLRGMAAPLRQSSASFAYDLKSYSQNFDDGFLHEQFVPCSHHFIQFLTNVSPLEAQFCILEVGSYRALTTSFNS